MRLHKVVPTLKVGDKVSTMNTLTRTRLHGIIINDGTSGGEIWEQVTFDDGITMWINAEQLEKEE